MKIGDKVIVKCSLYSTKKEHIGQIGVINGIAGRGNFRIVEVVLENSKVIFLSENEIKECD